MTAARVIVLVVVLVAIAVGSLVRPVEGQTSVQVVLIGQRMTMSYGERTVDCMVVETRGSFVRCGPIKPDAFSRPSTFVTWYNVDTVEYVSIRQSEQ
jgi:hypothetical protein